MSDQLLLAFDELAVLPREGSDEDRPAPPPAPARPKIRDKILAEKIQIRREHWWVQQVDPIPEAVGIYAEPDDGEPANVELEPDEDSRA